MTTTTSLTVNERALNGGFTHKFVIDTDDLTAAATTQTINLLTVAKGNVVGRCAMGLNTAFNDASASSSLTVQVGETDTDRFLAATQTHADGTEIAAFAGPGGVVPFAFLAADTVDILFTSGTGNVSGYTVGQITILLEVLDITELTGALV